jgi:hypothetical protein
MCISFTRLEVGLAQGNEVSLSAKAYQVCGFPCVGSVGV